MAAPARGHYDPAAMPVPAKLPITLPITSLDRYILRQCLSVTLFVTAALSAAVWLAQSLRLIDLIVNRGLSVEVFFYLAVLILSRLFDILLAIIALIAGVFLFKLLS